MGATWGQTSAERAQNAKFGDSRQRRGGSDGEGLHHLWEEDGLGEGVPLPQADPHEHGQ